MDQIPNINSLIPSQSSRKTGREIEIEKKQKAQRTGIINIFIEISSVNYFNE